MPLSDRSVKIQAIHRLPWFMGTLFLVQTISFSLKPLSAWTIMKVYLMGDSISIYEGDHVA